MKPRNNRTPLSVVLPSLPLALVLLCAAPTRALALGDWIGAEGSYWHQSQDGSASIDGGALSSKQIAELKQQIKAQPWLYVGQEKINFSSTPSLVGGKIEPRNALFRNFIVSNNEGYTAMAGGLTRTTRLLAATRSVSTSSGFATRASKTPAIFPIRTFSRRRSRTRGTRPR